MFCQNVISAVWCEPPAWLALNARAADDELDSTEDPVYHRPVLQPEVLRLLKPKSGSLIVDATCRGGGHTEALLESGADVLALHQDPDSVQNVPEQLAHFGRRATVRKATL